VKPELIQLTTSIHTIEIVCNVMEHWIKKGDDISVIGSTVDSQGRCKIKINPNIHNQDLCFSGFCETMESNIGLKQGDFYIARVDLRFDSYEESFYNDYAKLFNFLLSLFATKNGYNNKTLTLDLISRKQKDCSVKSQHGDIQLDYYNRELKSIEKNDIHDTAKTRLEIRSLKKNFEALRKKKERANFTEFELIKEEFSGQWLDRFKELVYPGDNLRKTIEETEDIINSYILKSWNEHREYYDNDIKNLLIVNSDRITSREQMLKLANVLIDDKSIDINKKMDNLKTRCGINSIFATDIQKLVVYMCKEIKKYFS